MRRPGRRSLLPRPARTSRCLRPIPAPSSTRCRQRRRPAAFHRSAGDGGQTTWRARRWPSARWPARTRSRLPRPLARRACPSTSSTRRRSRTFSFGSIVNRSPVVIGISTGWRRAGAGAGDPRQDRGVAASRSRRLGGGGASGCAPSSMRGCRWGRPAATLGAVLPTARWRHAARRPSSDLRDLGLFRASRWRIGGPGRRRAGRSGAADAEGPARAAIGRRHPVRPAGQPGDPRAGAARGAAHAGRQGRRRRLAAGRTTSTG